MHKLLWKTFKVLFCCGLATLPAFMTACLVGALLANNAPFPAALYQFVAFFTYGLIPCCAVGMVQALLCWALIPRVDRMGRRMLRALQPGRAPLSREPHTPGALPRVQPTASGVTAGVATGILLSVLNVPAYLAVSMLGLSGMALAFLSAGMVAGVILGWCRTQGDRMRELFTVLVLLP